MQIHYVNTATRLFCDPDDVSVPSPRSPVMPIDSPPVIRLCLLDGDGDPYTLTDRSTMSFSVTFDGAVVMNVPPGATRAVDPINGRVDILPSRVPGTEVSEGIGKITAIVDGSVVLDDSVLFTTGGDVVLPSSTKPNEKTNLRVITAYEEPSEGNVGDYVLFLGPSGLMEQGGIYQCVFSDGKWSWKPDTPWFVTGWRWHEYV